MGHSRAQLRTPADFGNALGSARRARGITQQQLAAELGVPQSTVSQLESGQSTIYLRRVLAAARTLDMQLFAEWNDDDDASG